VTSRYPGGEGIEETHEAGEFQVIESVGVGFTYFRLFNENEKVLHIHLISRERELTREEIETFICSVRYLN
jgi:hypothetical protein